MMTDVSRLFSTTVPHPLANKQLTHLIQRTTEQD